MRGRDRIRPPDPADDWNTGADDRRADAVADGIAELRAQTVDADNAPHHDQPSTTYQYDDASPAPDQSTAGDRAGRRHTGYHLSRSMQASNNGNRARSCDGHRRPDRNR